MEHDKRLCFFLRCELFSTPSLLLSVSYLLISHIFGVHWRFFPLRVSHLLLIVLLSGVLIPSDYDTNILAFSFPFSLAFPFHKRRDR